MEAKTKPYITKKKIKMGLYTSKIIAAHRLTNGENPFFGPRGL